MRIAFLGIVFLLAALFPVGDLLAPLLLAPFRSSLKALPQVFVHLVILAITFAPAAVITAWFLRASQLAKRVPNPAPGNGLVLAGVVLMLVYFLARLLASTVEGGGGSYVVMSFAPFVLWPARIMLVVGIFKLLLAAVPSNMSFQQTVPGGR